jgi:hypothetical protein
LEEQPAKRGRGRPVYSESDNESDRQAIREQLWTPGLTPVKGSGGQTKQVWLPDPPTKKGTSQYLAWAMECFLELLRHGYNYTQAAEKLGYDYQWWYGTKKRYPAWRTEAEEIVSGTGLSAWEYPDLSHLTFAEFCKRYGGFDLAEHQLRIAEALLDPYARLVLVLGHPESGKSTLVSLWYVLYRIAQDPDIRVALVSKSGSKAQDLLTRIKRYLTEDHLYDDTEGNLISEFNGWKPAHGELEWSADQIYIKHRKSGERDPTVQALGIGKQIYGARLDLLILDDSLVLDNQISELQRDRIDQWFTNEARSRAQRGQTVVNGTRLFPFDLYGQWKKSWVNNRLFRGVYIPAIYDEWTEQESPNWPEYWTLDGYDTFEDPLDDTIVTGYQPGLRDIRAEIMARDPARWRLVYQQEDVEQSENVFRMEHIEKAFELGSTRRLGTVMDHEILILGVDPATSGRAASVLLALDPETRVRTVVDIFVGSQLGATGIRSKLFYQFWDRYAEHQISSTVLEVNFAPTLMGDEAFLARAEAAGTRLVRHATIGRGKKRGSKWDEEYGISATASLFTNGLIAFPCLGEDDRTRLQPLIDDMLVFPYADAAQDAIVAFWVANGETSVTQHRKVAQQHFMERRGVPPGVRQRGLAQRSV